MVSLLTLLVSVLGAVLAGAGLGAWLARRRDRAAAQTDSVPAVDADMDPLIEYTAQRWALAYGRPEAAGLVAGKLRTLYRIKYGRSVVPPRRRRWFW